MQYAIYIYSMTLLLLVSYIRMCIIVMRADAKNIKTCNPIYTNYARKYRHDFALNVIFLICASRYILHLSWHACTYIQPNFYFIQQSAIAFLCRLAAFNVYSWNVLIVTINYALFIIVRCHSLSLHSWCKSSHSWCIRWIDKNIGYKVDD